MAIRTFTRRVPRILPTGLPAWRSRPIGTLIRAAGCRRSPSPGYHRLMPADAGPNGPPTYKGEPLDSERGPGLGCFWLQVIVLGVLLVLTPLTVVWAWDPAISAGLLILTLILLLFAGQTVIFLLRIVAADRRSRRRPLDPAARPTVGQIEETAEADASEHPAEPPAEHAPGPGQDGLSTAGRDDAPEKAAGADDAGDAARKNEGGR
jgi:hypothetical protein